MAITTFYLYPAANGDADWTSGSYFDIDDPWDAPDEWASAARLVAATNGTTSRNAFYCFGLSTPTTGLGINWIRVHLRLSNGVFGGVDPVSEPVINAGVRPGNSATFYNSSSRTIVNTGGCATASGSYGITTLPHCNLNTGAWRRGSGWAQVYWEFASNPVTASAWTVSDLQSLVLAIWADSGKGSPGAGTILPPFDGGVEAGTYFTSFFVEVNATLASASIEEKRVMQSALLKLVRSGTEIVQVGLPALAADVDLGGIVGVSHADAPDASGAGWGRQPWERHSGFVLGKTIDLGTKSVVMDLLDGFRFHCGLWFPAITDLPYTEEGQGIPYLDAGGGRSFTRYAVNAGSAKTKGYVKRQASDTLYAEVAVDKEKWSPDGLAVFRESYAALLNNSFALGTVPPTSWANGSAGGTVSSVTSDFLFDAPGLRQCVSLVGNYAGLYQSATLGAGSIRVHIISSRRVGTVGTGARFYRLYDGANFYRDDTRTWQAGAWNNLLATDAGGAINEILDTWSKVIPVTGTKTYTLYIYVAGASDNERFYYANLWWGASTTGGDSSSGVDMRRPPFVTTTAAAYEGQDIPNFANPQAALAWSPTRGTGLVTLKTAWSDVDMQTGSAAGVLPSKTRVVALHYKDGDNYDAVLYYKHDATTSYLVLKRRIVNVGEYFVFLTLTGADRPSVGSTMKIAWRWQALDGELGLGGYAAALFCSTDGRTPLKASGTLGAWTAALGTIYLASGFSSQWDGWVRGLELVPYVLTDAEIYRRRGL